MKKTLLYLLYFLLANVPLLGETTNNIQIDEGFALWIALFSLGAIGLLILFLSSNQLERFKKKTKDTEDNLARMNQTQSQILSNMGEHIQNIAQETVDTAQKLVHKEKEEAINQELSKVVSSEKKLLAITTNLIEFLRIKSKKIEIVNANLKLSNLLNDVTGTLKANTKERELELIYNIKSNIAENLIGDTLNISKVLVNILLFCIENNTKEIEVKISKNTILDTAENLYFTIESGVKIDINDETIFNSNYNEATGTYDSLGLFIAKELSSLMGGNLIAKNNKDGFLEFVCNIPFRCDTQTKHNKAIQESKKILIVDSSSKSATTLKNMFIELHHKAQILSKKDFLLHTPNFSEFDMVVIDEKLFTKNILEALQKSKSKIISLTNLFTIPKKYPNSKIAHTELSKPLTRRDLFQSIEKLYAHKSQKTISNKEVIIDTKTPVVHRGGFQDTPNIDLNTFAEFRGTKILLVEDNSINQKVVMGVLSKSAIDVTIANDGKEALDILHRENHFDIIFMDINMPIMDGYTATQMIRKEDKFNSIPIIALSALASKSEIDKMFSFGMNGYLGKPLKKEKLFTVFAIYIKKRLQDRRSKKREEKDLQSLDGLNIFNGLAQSSSNEIFYKEILIEFKDAYGESAQVFENLVRDFRYEQLRMFCVDIRGLSGAIGADDLHKLTTEILQRLVYKKFDLISSYIELYAKELSKINQSIDAYIEPKL